MTTRLHQRLVVALNAWQEKCQQATLEFVFHAQSVSSREMLAIVHAWHVLSTSTKIEQEQHTAKCATKERLRLLDPANAHRLSQRKVMVPSVQAVRNALQALASVPTVAVPEGSRKGALTVILVVTVTCVRVDTTLILMQISATSATVGRQVQLDPHQNYLA